jgi:hypothetical protein
MRTGSLSGVPSVCHVVVARTIVAPLDPSEAIERDL